MSNFAFGTYRISEHNPQHIEALKLAIESGITMIDTSSNYMDGSAERAIALALSQFDEDVRENIEIVSKFGYIQNENMARHKENPFDEVVEYSETCFHSISQNFIEDQLGKSLARLELTTLDCYLIHNPEYYLLDAIQRGIEKDDRLDEMYKRIFDAFMSLELAVQNEKIKSYGISSNSFSKLHSDEEFLPYEDLLTLAEDAAKEIGNDRHSFTTVQLPINLLEKNGLECAKWAKENGLRVLANRPLNALREGLMYRLADYDDSREYYTHFNELIDVCDNDALRPIFNLLEELDDTKHKFGWLGDYDNFLYAEIIPLMKNTIVKIDDEYKETLLQYIDLFLTEYRKVVAYECSKSTRNLHKEMFIACGDSMQECAINFLLESKNIDYVLVGMRKPTYVNELMSRRQ